MALILQKDSNLILCKEDHIIKFNTATNEEQATVIPQVIADGLKKVPIQDETLDITTACISQDGKYLAVANLRKQLVVYNWNLDVIKNLILARVASKVRFTHENNILVADKTGDAYLYQLTAEQNLPVMILGHLSMLLDILLTTCGKYVITCDRDEKIRVSHFPNAYNIASFCLGHREFVTNIEIIGDILVSASGDGTVRFWDYLTGRELHSITTGDYIQDKKVIESFCETMDKEKCEVSCLPITNMQILNVEKTYIAVSVLNYVVQIYSADSAAKNRIETKFLQFIVCDSSLITFSLGRNLFVLLNDGILWYQEDASKIQFNLVKSDGGLSEFYKKNRIESSKWDGNSDVSFLYKRKFDNVQEYLERKKLRLQIK